MPSPPPITIVVYSFIFFYLSFAAKSRVHLPPPYPLPPQRGRRGSCKAYLHYVSELQPHLLCLSESKVALAPPPLFVYPDLSGKGGVKRCPVDIEVRGRDGTFGIRRKEDKRKRLITFVYLSVPSCHFVSLVCQFTVFCSLAQCLILNK